ncbi:hypothetical protein [Pelomonas sp. KK5]|uniref:hypothetical protein n=1 Tax=Pelomonas sp. KK5 TaxID=1855730 RepID=UPI001301A0F3|nr:hypothetical protein [Pelomonas sp. KK5]
MNDLQKDWLTKLDAALAAQKNLDTRQQLKHALVAKLASDREEHSQQIFDGSDQTLVNEKGEKLKGLDYVKHRQDKEADIDDQALGYRLAGVDGQMEEWDPKTGTQEQFQKQLAAQRRVSQLAMEMEQQMGDELDKDGNLVYPTDKDGRRTSDKPNQVPLFGKEEIASEIYDPLKRRGLIPETAIPDKFSRTKEMLKGSFDAYGERVKRDEKGTAKRLFDENFGLAKSIGTGLFTVGMSGAQIEGARLDKDGSSSHTSWSPAENIKTIHKNLAGSPLDIANQRMAFAGQALTFTTDVAYEGGKDVYEKVTGGEETPPPGRIKLAPQLAQGIAGGAASAIGVPFAVAALGMQVSSTFGAVVGRKAIEAQLKLEAMDEAAVRAIATELGRACRAALVKLDPETGDSLAKLNAAADRIDTALQTQPAADAVLKALEEERYEAAVGLFQAAATAAVTAGVTPAVQALFASEAARTRAQGKAADAMEAEFNRDEEAEAVPDELKVKHRKDKPDHEADWVQGSGGVWVCAVCQAAASDDPAIFAGMLERKIARLEADQKLLKWGATLVGLGIDTAANFIAPLAIVGSALKVARNLYEAGKRTVDTINFVEKREGLYNAASAFSPAVSQFIHNGRVQQAHYYANAAFEAAKMIGAIMQVAGVVAAPAGVIVSASAGIAQAAEAVVYEANKRYDLEKAWSTYEVALSRPENRRLGLIAVRENPTLAKYAVAWGALIKKDALVQDFMGACDITPEVLKDPDANLDKVVKYLEARMPDDNVVTGRKIDGPAAVWAPAKMELTAASWITIKSLGVTKGGLADEDTRSFENGLIVLEEVYVAASTEAKAVPSTLSAQKKADCLKACDDAGKALVRYVPRLAEDRSFSEEMSKVKQRFEGMLTARKTEVGNWVAA